MATTLQWRYAGFMVAVTMVLLIGSADGCPTGFKDCKKFTPGCETNIKNDVYNCGGCGKYCRRLPFTLVKCVNYKCVYSCRAGWADCDRKKWGIGCETYIANDVKNCGKCGNKCKQLPNAITRCSKGKCQQPKCKFGWANCDANFWSNGCEKYIWMDIYNCGKCGRKCKVTLKGGEAKCRSGVCFQQCKRGTTFNKLKARCVPV